MSNRLPRIIKTTIARLFSLHVLVLLAGALLTTSAITIGSTNASAETGAKQLLFINSHHRGYGWSDEVESGLRETFESSAVPIELSVVYLDTLRHDALPIKEKLADILALKHVSEATDLVITSDNAALDFALAHQNELFPRQPIIYTALKDFSTNAYDVNTRVTGISEYTDYQQAINVALSLHPKTQSLAFIGSQREPHNQRIIDIIKESVVPVLSSKLDIEIYIDKSIDELDDMLSELPTNTIVFALSNTLPKIDGMLYSPAETARLLASVTPFPVYTFWHSHIGHGAIGGQIVTGFSQGKAAAQLALQVLASDVDAPLPSHQTAPASLFFDLEAAKKHRIDKNLLPEGARFINYQAPIWQEYKTEALTTLVIVFGLLSLVLAFVLLAKRQTETIHQISDENVELTHALDINQETLDDVTHQLEEVNTIDDLTGLANVRHFNDMLDKELRRASRYKTPLSLLLISVDQFDGYIHTHGEEDASEQLVTISQVIKDTCQRSSDVLAFLLDNKYAIILPHTTRDNSKVVCQKLHDGLKQKNLPFILSKTGAITLSIGLSSLESTADRINPQHMLNTSEMMRIDAERKGGNGTRSDVIAIQSPQNTIHKD
ncbi:diguanylate cyclase [Enterovibrio norvegicus FF-33]|uniref:diguanylate cyclase n=1 Tax=Enterovibrio norvegicus FF-454 TaxID=1185651 RepID=A0A1E5C8F6_9GAMM|nr:diguanylate cyclase [Enterovibrio norvegicus]OEE61811.1 diguanylate cyclase [Enterovibrio norvegicus FF-454]OEE66608.1 diguanylate cyclase [Enterovibrio norvegicus FF-33]OEE77631.1 diguanylate cyclase [Enterovibrio norvegicus FF-162]